jgi:hypothetical protein
MKFKPGKLADARLALRVTKSLRLQAGSSGSSPTNQAARAYAIKAMLAANPVNRLLSGAFVQMHNTEHRNSRFFRHLLQGQEKRAHFGVLVRINFTEMRNNRIDYYRLHRTYLPNRRCQLSEVRAKIKVVFAFTQLEIKFIKPSQIGVLRRHPGV